MLLWTGIGVIDAQRRALVALLAGIYKATPNFGQIKLYQNDYTPSIATAVGDLVEADFDGYAALDLDIADIPVVCADALGNTYAVDLIVKAFEQGLITPSNTVYGYYITDNTGATLLTVQRFATPIVFDHPGKHLDLEIGYRINAGSIVGGDDPQESV